MVASRPVFELLIPGVATPADTLDPGIASDPLLAWKRPFRAVFQRQRWIRAANCASKGREQ